MRHVIRSGNEEKLIASLLNPTYWYPTEIYVRGGIERERRVNIQQAAERLGLTEFNTWYVRGLAKRLMDEGVTYCQAYRAAEPRWEPNECSEHEGRLFLVEEIYEGIVPNTGLNLATLPPSLFHWPWLPSHDSASFLVR